MRKITPIIDNIINIMLLFLPKFLSPLRSKRMKTPICMRPSRAATEKQIQNNKFKIQVKQPTSQTII